MPLASIIDFFLLSAIWGSSFLFMHLAVGDFGPLAAACIRVSVAAVVLLPVMLARGLGPQFLRHWKAVCIVGILNSGLPFLFFAFALLSISTGLSAILNATAPLFGAVVAWAWLGERPGGSRTLGLVIGFIGVALLAWDKASFQPNASGIAPAWAVLACLGATVCYALAASATKKYLTGLPPLMTATGSQIGAALALAVPAAASWPARWPSSQAWVAVTIAGVMCTGIAYILYFRLIESTGASKALTVTFAVPVFAVIYGGLFLGEEITSWMLGCGAVIICGTALSTGLVKLPSLRRRRPA